MDSDHGKLMGGLMGDVMVEEIAVSKFKATCLRLLGNVKKSGSSILVTRKGEPIAFISPPPLPPKARTWLGSMRGLVEIRGDVVSPVVEDKEWEAMKD